MKPFILVPAALCSILLSGCGSSHAESASAAALTPAATFKEGRGLQFSPSARELAGLTTAEIAERDVRGTERGPAIPASALVRTVRGDFVYVANGAWFLRTPVKLGAGDDEWIRVTDGLYEGDRVVARGADVLWLAELQAVNGGVGCADGK